jgi:flagellar hook-length control protein FliK
MNAQSISMSSTAAPTAQTTGKADGSKGNAGFGQLLIQVIGGEVSGQSTGSQAAAPLLVQLMPEWVSTLGADVEQAEKPMEQDSLQALIGTLIELLESEQGEQLAQEPSVQAILSALQTLFAPLMDTGEIMQGHNQSDSMTEQLLPAPAQQLSSSNVADELKAMLQKFSAALSQQPHHEELQRMSALFQQIIQPLLEKLNVSSANRISGPSLMTEMDNEPTNSRPEAWTVNRLTLNEGAKLHQAVTNTGAIESVTVQTTAQNGLHVLAAKSMMPYVLVSSEATQAVSTDSQAASVESLAQETVTVGDLLRGTSDNSLVKAAPKEVNAAFFTREIAEMAIKQMKLTGGNGISEAKITLMPEHLGQVDVKISIHNGQVIAQFLTDSALGKDMIEGQLSQLRAALQSQGLQVDKLEVTQQQTQASGMFQEHRQQQNSGRSFEQQSKKSGQLDDGTIDFELSMNSLSDQHELESGSSTFIATA